jgi:hypothetical protein
MDASSASNTFDRYDFLGVDVAAINFPMAEDVVGVDVMALLSPPKSISDTVQHDACELCVHFDIGEGEAEVLQALHLLKQ